MNEEEVKWWDWGYESKDMSDWRRTEFFESLETNDKTNGISGLYATRTSSLWAKNIHFTTFQPIKHCFITIEKLHKPTRSIGDWVDLKFIK